ncbi:MAG: T9SS type A sorting domain-containing protein [Ignavibacteriae bacterium]|nr:T9SS type A sorting domain-containing protein [Ignavibacteriota bacterium]
MKKQKYYFLLFVIFFQNNFFAQDTFRVMTYNILNYPSKISSTRNPYFKKIIYEIKPDILVVQEMESAFGVELFINEVLDSNYTAGEFVDGYDTDNALFYKDSIFTFIDNEPINTALRNISKLTFVHKNTNDTLIIFSAHLKASDSETDRQKRLEEVKILRDVTDKFFPSKNYLLVGDLNIYYSTEPAFQELVDKTNSGYFLDPINQIGYWHNNSTYRGIHTQSTRLTNLSDEGSTGGLDDRFDMILASQSIIDTGGITYIPNSYKSFGNDGNHFNKAISAFPNTSVSDEIASALYYSSDHLPVFADFKVEPLTSIKSDTNIKNQFVLNQNYPNPFNASTTIKYSIGTVETQNFASLQLRVYDVLGREIKTLFNKVQLPGNYEIIFNAEDLISGVYFYILQVDDKLSTKKMILLK